MVLFLSLWQADRMMLLFVAASFCCCCCCRLHYITSERTCRIIQQERTERGIVAAVFVLNVFLFCVCVLLLLIIIVLLVSVRLVPCIDTGRIRCCSSCYCTYACLGTMSLLLLVVGGTVPRLNILHIHVVPILFIASSYRRIRIVLVLASTSIDVSSQSVRT